MIIKILVTKDNNFKKLLKINGRGIYKYLVYTLASDILFNSRFSEEQTRRLVFLQNII